MALNPQLRERLSHLRRRVTRPIEFTRFPPADEARLHYVRLVMNEEIDRLVDALNPANCDALEISGRNHQHRPWRSYEAVDYPAFDLCSGPPDGARHRYDFVVAEQVLEHVPEPLTALETMRDTARPGGTVLVTTPFLIRIHASPTDYWRFTPQGLEHLMGKAGLVDLCIASWGNRTAVRGAFYGWPKRRPWQSLRNEPELPTVVWGYGRVPETTRERRTTY